MVTTSVRGYLTGFLTEMADVIRMPYHGRCELNATRFLYGKNPGANSRHKGDRIQWSVQVSLNQLGRPLHHPGPSVSFQNGGYLKGQIFPFTVSEQNTDTSSIIGDFLSIW